MWRRYAACPSSMRSIIIEADLDLDEPDLTAIESKAAYNELKAYVPEKFGWKVSDLYISQV